MRRKIAKSKMPRNCVARDGRLYFNRYHRGKRYSAPFWMPNSNEWRRRAGLIARRISADMALGVFDPNDHGILSKYHTSNDGSDLPTFSDHADIWLDKKRVLAPATQRTYRHLLQKHLTPYFSTYHVDQINKPMVKSCEEGPPNPRVRNVRQMEHEPPDEPGFTRRENV